jgi:hypothetical protein
MSDFLLSYSCCNRDQRDRLTSSLKFRERRNLTPASDAVIHAGLGHQMPSPQVTYICRDPLENIPIESREGASEVLGRSLSGLDVADCHSSPSRARLPNPIL